MEWSHQQQRLIFGSTPPPTDDPKINHFIPNHPKKRESGSGEAVLAAADMGKPPL